MTSIFIGGSRNIGRLNSQIRERIDAILSKGFHVYVGDANGADKAIQQYLNEKNYKYVEVFCTGSSFRNNIGHWKVRYISAQKSKKDFDFYAAKDQAMAEEADYGFMLWDGESVGTLMNLQRLARGGKKSVVYVSPEKIFMDVKSYTDWEDIIRQCSLDVQERISKTSSRESLNKLSSSQSSFL